MKDQPRLEQSDKGRDAQNDGTGAKAKAALDGDAAGPVAAEGRPSKKLTAEEQMALYEKELQENDWGHQPC